MLDMERWRQRGWLTGTGTLTGELGDGQRGQLSWAQNYVRSGGLDHFVSVSEAVSVGGGCSGREGETLLFLFY